VKYLVDANVLSELTKPAPDLLVIEWLRENEREIAVDPVILGDLRFGILILPRGRKRLHWNAGSIPELGVSTASLGTQTRD
jgi:predicted nucleic acid-binding protein